MIPLDQNFNYINQVPMPQLIQLQQNMPYAKNIQNTNIVRTSNKKLNGNHNGGDTSKLFIILIILIIIYSNRTTS
jgi:hypothetical protein